MEGADLCQEIVKRASSGFVYSEAVARYVTCFPRHSLQWLVMMMNCHEGDLGLIHTAIDVTHLWLQERYLATFAPFFTAQCTRVQSTVLLSRVICPSVRPSVTLVDHDHIG